MFLFPFFGHSYMHESRSLLRLAYRISHHLCFSSFILWLTFSISYYYLLYALSVLRRYSSWFVLAFFFNSIQFIVSVINLVAPPHSFTWLTSFYTKIFVISNLPQNINVINQSECYFLSILNWNIKIWLTYVKIYYIKILDKGLFLLI